MFSQPVILTIHRLSHIQPGIEENTRKIGRHIETIQEAILLSDSTRFDDFGSEQVAYAANIFNYHAKLGIDAELAWCVMLQGPRRRKIVNERNWDAVKRLLIASREELVMAKKPDLILVVGPVVKQNGVVKKVFGKVLEIKRAMVGCSWL